MKRSLLFCALTALLGVVSPSTSQAQQGDKGRLGFALNSGLNSELQPVRLVPTVLYTLRKNQLELGVGFHPFIRPNQRIISTELNHKFFVNGTDATFNPYLISRLMYANNKRETYYPTAYNYLFLNAGYGLMMSGQGRSYFGTNVTFGAYTFSRRSDNPYEGFASQGLFSELGLNVAFQFNVGYRL